MNKVSKESLPPEDRKEVEMIAKGAGGIMFDKDKNLPMDYRMRLEDVIKNAYRILDENYWTPSAVPPQLIEGRHRFQPKKGCKL